MSGLFLSLPATARFTRQGADRITLSSGPIERTFSDPCAATMVALEQLANGGDDEDRLVEPIVASGGAEALARFHYWLHLLSVLRLLSRSARQGECRLATLTGISPYFAYAERCLVPETRYLISRFAHARVHAGEYVLESPLSHARITLHDRRAAAALHALARPTTADELAGVLPDLTPNASTHIGTLLLSAGMLTEQSGVATTLEDEDRSLRSWEFHDLLFHARSRHGRHDGITGGTFRFAGEFEPPPAIKRTAVTARISLDRPNQDALAREAPLASVQEARRSIRQYGARPVTLRALGEFLYRVGRVTSVCELDVPTPAVPIRMEFARRPYPAGGAMYELELYVVVNACDGLAAGLYHYDALSHALEQLSGRTTSSDALLLGASVGTGIPREHLQVLLVITSRFQRMSWKYSSMAYAATLKNVGVLFQTMYLVATAMQLAPCAVGCGDSDCFARAIPTDYYDETSVGEFLLGSTPDRSNSSRPSIPG